MFDVAIIGGGPGGYSAAFEAAHIGLSVILFEKEYVGGTCLNRGCVPTKYLSHVSRKIYEMKHAEQEGIFCKNMHVDFSKTHERMEEIILFQRDGLRNELAQKKIQLVKGEAEILRPSLVTCNGEDYSVKNIIIATGSKSGMPIYPGAITSSELLSLDTIPFRINILGGGTVAVEFAYIYAMLESEVHIYIRADRILRKWDKEIAVGITQSLKRLGVQIHKNCDFNSLEIDDGVILSAAGRIPVVPPHEAGLVEIGDKGGIIVDNRRRTSCKEIYAIGDVIEDSEHLAHVAMEQGCRAIKDIIGREGRYNYPVVKCIYTNQEVASVGITEEDAAREGTEIVVAKVNMYSNARTIISTTERGFIKLIARKGDKVLIGAHLMCERAGDIITELAIAISEELSVEKMLRIVRPHPSYCEEVTNALKILEIR